MSLGAAAEVEQEYPNTKRGWQQRWQAEFDAARQNTKDWHESAEGIVKRFLDHRSGRTSRQNRVNLFTSNVQILRALLYGKTPQVDVDRRFGDALDDVARTAGELLQRVLNTDIKRDSDSYGRSLEHALDDFLIVGLGNVRLRYVVEFDEQEPVEEQRSETETDENGEPKLLAEGYTPPPVKRPGSEDVAVDYVHWKNQLWNPCRTTRDLRWWAFKETLTKAELVKRFGTIGKRVPLNTKKGKKGDLDAGEKDPWARADVWEIWDKESKRVWWFVEGFDRILDVKDDPLELEGFWPFPEPLFANLTTSSLMPRPDFALAEDLYAEIDEVTSRIVLLERCIKVAGVYDKNSPELKRLISEAQQNQMIPVTNYAQFVEKGGLKGQTDWFPLDMFVEALDKLREYRTELMNLLFQLTGMSDIMRGQAQAGATATEQAIKAKFASVRVQHLQDRFAKFASDVQQLKAEIIAKHFEPETILEKSNAQYMFDAALAEQAVQLIQSEFRCYRVDVKPESVSLTDYAQLKQERAEFVNGLAVFLQSSAPLIQMMPQSLPFLLQMLQWSMAGFRGSSTIEGVLDQAIAQVQQMLQAQAQQPQQGQQQDPKMMQLQMKGQMDQAHTKMELQADLTRMQTQAKLDMQREQHKHSLNMAADATKIRGQALKDAVSTVDKVTEGA